MCRNLTAQEKVIVRKMLSSTDRADQLLEKLDDYRVVEAADHCGLGGIDFLDSEGKVNRMSETLVGACSVDQDGMLLHMHMNLDHNGEICGLEIWKEDGSAIVRYPEASEIRIFGDDIKPIEEDDL